MYTLDDDILIAANHGAELIVAHHLRDQYLYKRYRRRRIAHWFLTACLLVWLMVLGFAYYVLHMPSSDSDWIAFGAIFVCYWVNHRGLMDGW